ncbi:MAG TPA: 5'-nucleotidase [Flavobacterium sp.]|jgi:2',3'-cyclic-nucleotide 2'-phosphodiesterase (5'-nucleotidase family)
MNSLLLRAVNLKKYNVALMRFVLLLTVFTTFCCARNNYSVTKIEGKEIGITDKNQSLPEFENTIRPYRENIDRDLNTVLAYSPQTLDKSQGQWQTTIGNLMADAALERGNRIFATREKKNIDMCLLNFGGIRSIIPKGNVTTRTAFEIMPFENSLVVATLPGEQVLEMVNYIIAEKKAHPVAGLSFTIGKDNLPKNINIAGKPLDTRKVYYVVTSDYLINGGDNMVFFKNSTGNFDLDYKLRNVLIDYFKEKDTIPVINDIRISRE